jgi:tetratricopeptide (TPR) repeat protein
MGRVRSWIRKSSLAVVVVLICLLASARVYAQERTCFAPISKFALLTALHEKIIPASNLLERIKGYGVSFRMSSTDEAEIRKAAKHLKTQVLDNLISLVSNSFHVQVLVLIADIQNDDPIKSDATRIISDQLYKATKQYPDVCIDRLYEVIAGQTDKEANELAIAKGKYRNANIIIWGRLLTNQEKARVSIHFSVIQASEQLALEEDQERTVTAPLSEVRDFTLQEQLSKEMTYLTLLTVGLIRYGLGDYDGAIQRFNDGMNSLPRNVEIVNPGILHFYKASALYHKGQAKQANCKYEVANAIYEEAINELNEAISSLPVPEAYANRATVYSTKSTISNSISEFDRSIEDYNRAIKLQKNSTDGYFNRGNAYLRKHDYDNAIKDFDLAIGRGNDCAPCFTNRGSAYFQRAQINKSAADLTSAIQDCNRAIELQKDSIIAYINRGAAYLNTDKVDQAMKDIDVALGLDQNSSNAYFYKGLISEKRQEPDVAIANYTKAIDLRCRFTEAYYNRARIYANKEKLEDSIRDFTKVIEIDDKMLEAYYNRAGIHFMRSNFKLAIDDLTKVMELSNPKTPSVILENTHKYRGTAYHEMGRYKDAIQDFDEAIRIHPDFSTYFYRGTSFVRSGEIDLAIKDFSEAIGRNPLIFIEAYINRADAYIREGEYDKAIADCTVVLSSKPNLGEAYVNRGEAYIGKGDSAKGLAEIKKGLELNTDPEFRDRVAKEVLARFGLKL